MAGMRAHFNVNTLDEIPNKRTAEVDSILGYKENCVCVICVYIYLATEEKGGGDTVLNVAVHYRLQSIFIYFLYKNKFSPCCLRETKPD